jgi:ISXO2-like transposase domain
MNGRYQAVDKRVKRHSVNHSAGEYVRHFYAHVNGMESVWALFKRQVYGIHHWVSDKHLHRYISEATWRFNLRGLTDVPRMAAFLGRTDGRLKYRTLIAQATLN